MSRVGKKPVILPKEVKAELKDNVLSVKGPKGALTFALPNLVQITIGGEEIVVSRKNEERFARAQHGLVRTLIQNMIQGVTQMFTKELEIKGVGYRAEVKGPILQLSLGFSHPIKFPIPEGIKIAVKKQTEVMIEGCDKMKVGQLAAEVRSLRSPEPYQGKGIRYKGEVVKRKVGKAAAGATGA